MLRWIPFLAIALLSLLLSCGNKSGDIVVRLTDAPGPYDHVYVDVTGVALHHADGNDDEFAEHQGGDGGRLHAGDHNGDDNDQGEDDDEGWVTIAVTPTTVDLLSLQNGVTLMLAQASVPAGTYDRVRLVISSATVVVNGRTVALRVPPGKERHFAVDVTYSFVIDSGGHVEIVLDFDAHASVHEEGSGIYSLAPVLKVKED